MVTVPIYSIRPATNADRDAIVALVFGVLGEYGLSPDPETTDADLNDIEGAYQASGGMFDVLVDAAGTMVGTVGLFPMADSTCELRKMYLLASCRGQGLGRRMLEHAIERARVLGFKTVTLETASVLKEAIALYERYGFKPYTPDHLAQRCDQAYRLELD
jgi:putative acetyltransferase